MIHEYNLNDNELVLESDLAAEFPLYLYLSDKKDYLLYSDSIHELLESSRVQKPLKVTAEGVSFLLQSGVVPLPNTVYENVFIVSIGQKARIQTSGFKIEVTFSYMFPFLNDEREKEGEVDEEYILELLAEATTSKIKEGRTNYLFHSAGKDSNSIALALAEAGYQDKITSVTHQGEGEKDESELAKKIATKFGFKHEKIYEPKVLENHHLDSLNRYFTEISFPCMDTASLAYPLYTTQLDFNNSNIIDGMGNDVFIGHIPDSVEYSKQQNFSRFHVLRPITGKFSSGTRVEIGTATRVEWVGLAGLTFGDSRTILGGAIDVHDHWSKIDRETKDWDYLDLRASVRGVTIDQEIFTRKVRNFADLTHSNLILPWTNQKVVEYFSRLPEELLFDRKGLKNKLALRKMLKERIGLDSDKLGKMAYGFNFYAILMMMKREVDHEILSCALWNEKGVERVLATLYRKIDANHKSTERLKGFVQRLYLISAWYNNSRYL